MTADFPQIPAVCCPVEIAWAAQLLDGVVDSIRTELQKNLKWFLLYRVKACTLGFENWSACPENAVCAPWQLCSHPKKRSTIKNIHIGKNLQLDENSSPLRTIAPEVIEGISTRLFLFFTVFEGDPPCSMLIMILCKAQFSVGRRTITDADSLECPKSASSMKMVDLQSIRGSKLLDF